jgi:Ran GTPase-activating protein (RanGAP) involved in mRNA processing and transport
LNDEGAEAIAEGLQKNRKVSRLSLVECGVNERGGLAIAHTLTLNVSLRTLDISSNRLGEKVGAALASSLELNTTLEVLRHSSCEFSDNDKEKIAGITKRNREARVSRERDAMLFSRNVGSHESSLPSHIGGFIMDRIRMLSDTTLGYEDTATAVQLSLNALGAQAQHKTN